MERIECRYNIGVECSEQTNCDRCGWNPQVNRKPKEPQKRPEPKKPTRWILGKGNFESLEKLA